MGDDQTPSECLKRHLSRDLKARVEVLNTGHLGYSPEQEYYTLREYADRFRPRFVVLNLFANDFGDLFEVFDGKGDWEEGKYWLGRLPVLSDERVHLPDGSRSLGQPAQTGIIMRMDLALPDPSRTSPELLRLTTLRAVPTSPSHPARFVLTAV